MIGPRIARLIVLTLISSTFRILNYDVMHFKEEKIGTCKIVAKGYTNLEEYFLHCLFLYILTGFYFLPELNLARRLFVLFGVKLTRAIFFYYLG